MKNLDGRTKAYKELCNKIAYADNVKLIGFKGETVTVQSTFSHFDNSYIGEGAPHKCDYLKALIARGVTEQIQHRRLAKKNFKEYLALKLIAQIGFNPKQKKWYGWSHRAIHGFGIGSEFWRDTEKTKKRICKTLDDCKLAASEFAESVS